ncbi:MAG: GH116 family glycosyl hydrolase [Planctomycetota bacterium]
MGRLFPELEINLREIHDFGSGFNPQTGSIDEQGTRPYAADGQCEIVLRSYRDHRVSPDGAFLKRNWPSIRKAMTFLLVQDGNDDGLIENHQPNTYDGGYWGANTFVGSLYLAALLAAEKMADLMGDRAFATRCGKVFESGSKATMKGLFNGEYFIQTVDLKKHPHGQYGEGCHSDHVFGQAWAHQLGLGYVYPKGAVRKALRAIYKYNWAPDVGPYMQAHRPERVFARPKEAGLFTCTWPKSAYLPTGARYKNEIWTGIEYQVAGHMIHEGMVEEGLVILRGIHDRYNGEKHNPFNEVECGDHYIRAMASWGCLIAAEGFTYDGPRGRIGFDPRIGPEDFRGPFTGAEGWGSFTQKREPGKQVNTIDLRWGKLRLTEVEIVVPKELRDGKVTVAVGERALDADAEFDVHGCSTVKLKQPLQLTAGQVLRLTVQKK